MTKKILLLILLMISMSWLSGCKDNADMDIKVFRKEGTYEVGEDFPAGDYVLVANRNSGYYLIKKSKGAILNENDDGISFLKNMYITLRSGDWIQFIDANLCRVDDFDFGGYQAVGMAPGHYKVGKDLPSGKYLIVNNDTAGGMVTVTAMPENSIESNLSYYSPYQARMYVNLEDNQYIRFTKGKIYQASDAPEVVKEADGSIMSGQYAVGTDLEPGMYIIIGDSTGRDYEIYADGMSKEPFIRQSYTYRHYVQLSEGNFINFEGKLYPETQAPDIVKLDNDTYQAGQYLIGRDLESGFYEVSGQSVNGYWFYELTTSPYAKVGTPEYLMNDSGMSPLSIELKDGDYIRINGILTRKPS